LRVLSAAPPLASAGASIEACNQLQNASDEWGEARLPKHEFNARSLGERDPTNAFNEAAHAASRRDLRIVVQDLAAEGKRPGQIARMFGLEPVEVREMLRAKP
jgi:hypothetical protein